MKTVLQEIVEKTRKKERAEKVAIETEIADPATPKDRRNFLKKAALGGIALGGLIHLSVEDTIAQTTQKVSRASSPSDLRITDLRVASRRWKGESKYGGYGDLPARILKIYTNQGITGIGDIRDGADQRFGLFLKSKIVGLNPCNVEMIFKVIRQFGFHGRQGSGISAVEAACWDLAGKAFGVPVWALLGGRYRDKIRLYADTPDGNTPEEQREKLRKRVQEEGYTWLKMDQSLPRLNSIMGGGLMNNNKFWGTGLPRGTAPGIPPVQSYSKGMENYMSYGNTDHPFTQIQITDEGLEAMAQIVAEVREVVGMEVPISSDHYGYMDENQFIRLGKAVEKYRLAWLEDTLPWYYHERLRSIKMAIETPLCTGEDIYMLGGMLGGFKPLIDAQCVDIVHPDMHSAGGILETKKIGDYAEEAGIPMAMHHNSSPVAFMANVHGAAATENFLCLEHHFTDDDSWEGLVIRTDGQPLVTKGFGNVPLEAPGLGIELNDEAVKALMPKGQEYFPPTPEWDSPGRTYDKLWI